ncbi:hypothetical protein DNH61_19160 [Paenibacillus sambharensis]|uniref:4,4'-diaponeurosporenoate glycosyltransferase n=1 Tax=Paenibacillus sambharensis TaxID=1803190 RepID=A0A2W1L7F6_9BACL|nr:glycosyltransferase family 2 protein [Paenibacillus sambharensis]PZD94080.1 hypothetical protein DNH61_19160 [Paenibacillus sambharensis]
MEIVLWVIAAVLLLQLIFALWNVRQLPAFAKHGVSAEQLPGETPRLSVLIPARNEEKRLPGCLESLIAADPELKDIEILVLDDRSDDGTARVARSYAAKDARIRLLDGMQLPAGWAGKCHACMQLAGQASGNWLLFMDADARVERGALSRAAAAAEHAGSGMITGFPYQETGSWLERLVVPMMGFTIACHLPIRLIADSQSPMFAAAHGAWIMLDTKLYHSIGGHASIRDELVDDMALAKCVKRAGGKLLLTDVRGIVRMRMYSNAGEVWSGFRKNVFAGLGRRSLLLFMIMLLYSLLYLMPAVCLAVSPWNGPLLLPALAGFTAAMLIKRTADRMQGQPVWLCLLYPASIAAVLAIAASSWGAHISGKGYNWKGRVYR